MNKYQEQKIHLQADSHLLGVTKNTFMMKSKQSGRLVLNQSIEQSDRESEIDPFDLFKG